MDDAEPYSIRPGDRKKPLQYSRLNGSRRNASIPAHMPVDGERKKVLHKNRRLFRKKTALEDEKVLRKQSCSR
jgi:hypothetical protein